MQHSPGPSVIGTSDSAASRTRIPRRIAGAAPFESADRSAAPRLAGSERWRIGSKGPAAQNIRPPWRRRRASLQPANRAASRSRAQRLGDP